MEIQYSRLDVKDEETLAKLIKIEKEAFGDTALSTYEIVPIVHHGKVFAAYDGDIMCAAVYLLRDFEDTKIAFIMSIGLLSKYRGQDIGPSLLAFAFDDIKKDGIKVVELTVDPANASALLVYREKLGFSAIESRENEYGEGEDRLVMQRIL